MNPRIMFNKYSREKDFDLFGYTYIPANPEAEKNKSIEEDINDENNYFTGFDFEDER